MAGPAAREERSLADSSQSHCMESALFSCLWHLLPPEARCKLNGGGSKNGFKGDKLSLWEALYLISLMEHRCRSVLLRLSELREWKFNLGSWK